MFSRANFRRPPTGPRASTAIPSAASSRPPALDDQFPGKRSVAGRVLCWHLAMPQCAGSGGQIARLVPRARLIDAAIAGARLRLQCLNAVGQFPRRLVAEYEECCESARLQRQTFCAVPVEYLDERGQIETFAGAGIVLDRGAHSFDDE